MSVSANLCFAFRSVFSKHCLLEIVINPPMSSGSMIRMKQPRLEEWKVGVCTAVPSTEPLRAAVCGDSALPAGKPRFALHTVSFPLAFLPQHCRVSRAVRSQPCPVAVSDTRGHGFGLKVSILELCYEEKTTFPSASRVEIFQGQQTGLCFTLHTKQGFLAHGSRNRMSDPPPSPVKT